MKSRRIRRKLDALVTSGAGASGTKEVEDQCGTRYRPRQLKGEPRRAERIMLGLTDVGPPVSSDIPATPLLLQMGDTRNLAISPHSRGGKTP